MPRSRLRKGPPRPREGDAAQYPAHRHRPASGRPRAVRHCLCRDVSVPAPVRASRFPSLWEPLEPIGSAAVTREIGPGGAVPLLAPSACPRAGLPSSQPSLRCHPVCPTVPSVLVQSHLFHCHSLLLSFWQHGNSLSRPSLALALGTRRFLEAGFPRRLRHLLRPGEMFHPAAPSGDWPPGAAREEKWGPEGPDPGVSPEDPCLPCQLLGCPGTPSLQTVPSSAPFPQSLLISYLSTSPPPTGTPPQLWNDLILRSFMSDICKDPVST